MIELQQFFALVIITYQNRIDKFELFTGNPRFAGGDGLNANYYQTDACCEMACADEDIKKKKKKGKKIKGKGKKKKKGFFSKVFGSKQPYFLNRINKKGCGFVPFFIIQNKISFLLTNKDKKNVYIRKS